MDALLASIAGRGDRTATGAQEKGVPMFGRNRDTDTDRDTRTLGTHTEAVRDARGGVSLGAILTGVVVAFGAMFLLFALVGGVIAAIAANTDDIARGEAVDIGIGAGIAIVVAQLLAYLWGGYTAGRMARGAGVLNGLLVPIVALVLAALIGAIVGAFGANATNLNLPFSETRLPTNEDLLLDWGVGLGIAALVAMLLGGIIGGALGAGWHAKLERRALEDYGGEEPVVAGRTTGTGEHRVVHKPGATATETRTVSGQTTSTPAETSETTRRQ